MLVELVKGAVGGTDWHQGKKYNVQRISGLESQSALVVLTRTNLHILTGFRVKHMGTASGTGGYGTKAGEGRVVVEWVASMESAATARDHILSSNTPNTSSNVGGSSNNNNNNSSSSSSSSSSSTAFSYSGSFDRGTKSLPTVKESSPIKKTALAAAEAAYAAAAVGLTGYTGQPMGEVEWLAEIWKEVLSLEDGYRCFPLDEVHTVFKRRHQLKYTALRITDTSGSTLLFSCDSEAKCDEVLLRLFEADLPASLFHQVIGIKNLQLLRGLSNMYNRLMALFLSSATSKWLKGEVSNFDYLMHVNVAAGRSFQDLTQYPVFPWVSTNALSPFFSFFYIFHMFCF
jgi:Beige/BEACH domain